MIIGGTNYGEFFWDNGTLPGNLQVSKAAAGPAEYVGDKWVQKYTVRFVSQDNKTTIQSVADISGAGLTAVGNFYGEDQYRYYACQGGRRDSFRSE